MTHKPLTESFPAPPAPKAGLGIIIPCLNAGPYILETVQSANAHNISGRLLDIIIVPDGPQDEPTLRALYKACAIENVRVFPVQERQGQSHARNVALAASPHPFVLPLDADDMMNNDPALLAQKGSFYDRAITALEGDPGAMCVYSDIRMFGACEGLMSHRRPPYDEKTFLTSGLIGAPGVFRREEALTVLYDEKLPYDEDWGFWLAMLNARLQKGQERKVVYCPEDYYLYRQHGHNDHVDAKPKDYTLLFESFLKKAYRLYSHHLPGLPADVTDAAAWLKAQMAVELKTPALPPAPAAPASFPAARR